MAELSFQVWIPIVAIVLGIAVASVLYLKNKKQYYSKWLTVSLFALRTIAVACIVMLAINPFLTINDRKVEKPVAILLCDNSASVVMCSDSLYYKDTFAADVESVKETLSEHYDVEEFLFGDSLRKGNLHDFADNTTNLSEALSQLKRNYYKRNVGAVLFFSDGIANAGTDVVHELAQYPFRIHSLVMGDTLHRPDMMVKSIRANGSVTIGSTFPIQAVVCADNCKGKAMSVSLEENGRVLSEKRVDVTSDKFAREEVFLVNADQAKMHHYVIKVSGIDGESAIDNNSKSVFVDVKSQKYKVVMLASSPHPDIAALQSVMDDDYDVKVFTKNDAVPELLDVDMLVVYGALARQHFESLERQLEKYKKLPLFIIQGDGISVEQFNRLQNTFHLSEGSTRSKLELKASFNGGFSVFSLPEAKKANAFPPLSFPYLEVRANQQYDALFYQQVLGVNTTIPLLSFADNGRKTAFLFGDGIWRWRLFDFYQNANHNLFDGIFSKAVKYLILENDKSFTVHYNDAYYGGADVVVTAVLRNASNEVVTDADVRLDVENMASGERFEHRFYAKDGEYEAKVGRLPEGAYQFSATTEVGGRTLRQNGTFVVANAGIEAQYLTADVDLLMQMAALTGGSCRNVGEMAQLAQQLRDDETITSIEHFETRYRDLISLKWIFFVIIAAATIEWLLRKIFGTY